MLKHLAEQVASGHDVAVDVVLKSSAGTIPGDQETLHRCGLYGHDSTGMALEVDGKLRLVPWTSVAFVDVDVE